MIVKNMGDGAKIPYEVDDNRITFDDDLSINLAKREADYPVHIDVCFDIYGYLTTGVESAHSYVAQLDIPARQYDETAAEVSADGGDDMEGVGQPEIIRTPKPFDPELVTLTLWDI